MTFVSKFALAAMLALGGTALSASPALAQKKDAKAQAGAQLKLSNEFRKAGVAGEEAIKAKNWTLADQHITAAEAVAKSEDEKYFAARLRLQIELGRESEEGQLKAMTALVANPRTAPEDAKVLSAAINFIYGSRAAAAKNHADTIKYMLKAREFGSVERDVPILLSNAYASTGNQAESVAEVGRAIELVKGQGLKAPESWYQFAIPKVNALGDRAQMVDWLSRFITAYPTVKNWHWAIQVFRSTAPAGANARIEKLDGFRLMRATKALANRGDYADYAFAAQQAGLPWEAVSVIDEGRASGKIPAGDADVARTYTAAQNQAKAEGSLDALAKQAASAADGKAASQTGDAFLASGNYARAVEMYDLALSKGNVKTDEVNLHRGIALQNLGRKDDARTAFAAVNAGPLANLATLYTTSLDLPPLS